MAQAIKQIADIPRTSPRKAGDSESEVLDPRAVTALAKVSAILLELDKLGILDAVLALFVHSEEVTEKVIGQVTNESMVRGIKNAMTLVSAFSQVNPSVLTSLTKSLAMSTAAIQSGEVMPLRGPLDIWKASRDEDVSQGMSVLVTLLKHIGQAFPVSSISGEEGRS